MPAKVQDEYRPLDSLVQNPRNYNVHSEQQIERLADAIRLTAYTAPLIVTPEGTILGGHLRRLALLKLRADSYPEPQGVRPGWQVPCRVVDCNEVDQLRILATDNPDPAQVEFDNAALASLLTELNAEEALPGTWYDEARLEELIGELAGVSGLNRGTGGGVDPQAEWQGMPEFVQEDKTAYRTLHVHFADEDAVQEFARLIGQEFSPEARYIWHPKLEREDFMAYRYADESQVSGLHHQQGALGEPLDGAGANGDRRSLSGRH